MRMTILKSYDYLVRAAGTWWTTLEGLPDEGLSRPCAWTARGFMHQDLLMSRARFEDCWLHE